MNKQTFLNILITLIWLLSAFAAGMGIFYDTPGEPYAYTTLRGEQVMIQNHGLYRNDTVSSAAQMQGADFITLVVGLPLLAVSCWLAWRGSLRGRLLLAGTLGYFLYTYMSMAFNTAFNALFLVYVGLFSGSLIAFVLCLMTFDLASLPGRFSEKAPRGWIAGMMFFSAAFLLVAWVGGRVLPPLTQGAVPMLENALSMVIQAMDLGLIVPLCLFSGVLLLKRSAWGYLLGAVGVMKFITMGLSVSAMGINQALQGAPGSPAVVGVFIAITAANLVLAVLLLRSIDEKEVLSSRGLVAG